MAEVLITLTIIGVIAAITIPNLVQSWRKHEVEVKVKEAYSIVANIIQKSEVENSGFLYDFFPTGGFTYDWVNQYIKPYVKVSKIANGKYIYTDFYKGNSIIKFFENTNGVGMNDSRGVPGGFISLVLENGMILNINSYSGYSDSRALVFLADINEVKGPNRYGTDLFGFSYYAPTSGYYAWKGGLVVGYNYGYATQIINGNVKNNCINTGYTCSTWIMKNSWKIPDDYPVKKW